MKIEIKEFESLKYIVRYPDNYKEGERFPVIIFLHGAGTRGDNINVLQDNVFLKATEEYQEFPFITVAPQCHHNTWFDVFEQLKGLVLATFNEDFTDKNRLYLVGTSMGGYGAWQLAMSMPDLFAAVVPVCGGGMYWNAGRLKSVPVWAFHGGQDDVVKVEESIKMVDAVNASGGRAKLTIYPENNHDAWSDTYSNPEVFKWLLSNTNYNEEVADKYTDSAIYG